MNCSGANVEFSKYHSHRGDWLLGCFNILFTTIGTSFDLLIVTVYTRQHTTSPMHKIIAHLSAVDALAMVAYVPPTVHTFFLASFYTDLDHRTQFWETVSLCSSHLNAIFSHTSTWLTVMLAMWRYIVVRHPFKERSWCKNNTARFFVAVCYLMGFVVSMPGFFSTRVAEKCRALNSEGLITPDCWSGNHTSIRDNCTARKVFERELRFKDTSILFVLIFSFYGLVAKTLPCIVLTVISFKLICGLYQAKSYHNQLTHTTSISSNRIIPKKKLRSTARSANRITIMLVLILALFILKEIPHGICCFLTAARGKDFYRNTYEPVREILNTVRCVCTGVHFIVFHMMSYSFRKTFNRLFRNTPSAVLNQNTIASCNAHQICQSNV